MKKNKWTKWTVGALGALGMFALFHEIKDSPAYAAALAKLKSDGGKQTASSTPPQDSKSGQQRPNSPDQAYGNDGNARMQQPRRHRGDAFGSSQGGGSLGTSPNSTVQPHTRTTRS